MKTGNKFFFSPQPTTQTNTYVKYFFETLSKYANVVNFNKKPTSQSFDIFRYAFRSNIMVLNWPEDIIHLRYGVLQNIISTLSLCLYKIIGGKIVWVCHNKQSHIKKFKWLNKINRVFFSYIADFIIVHSDDAINHFKHFGKKVYFLNHPVYEKTSDAAIIPIEDQIDILIWGTIIPYKGLSEFIKQYKKANASFKVKIIGKADKEYFDILKNNSQGLNILIEDKFLNEQELNVLFNCSKIVLLPYLITDTFSSGALIHSLNSKKIIIGPDVGNFIDLSKRNACLTFSNYKELFFLLEELLIDKKKYSDTLSYLQKGIEKYYLSNSWDAFIKDFITLTNSRMFK